MVAVDQLQSNAGLSKVWLASHYENKITKSQLLNTDLNSAIEYLSNLESEEPIALRVSGQLLLGVVRIHSRKTKYLLEDCNGTLSKIKMVFKQGNVNMADTSRTKANVETITLAETLNDIDLLLPDPSAVLNDDGRDSMFDSATQDFSNSFFDISAEHGRLLDSEQDLDNLMNDIEMGRRDQDPALEQSFSADLDSPMNKLQINDQRNVDEDIGDFGELDFDFDLGDDLSQREQTPRPEFHLPAMDDNLDASLDTLMQDGIVPMADSNALMFGLDDDSSITQQQASSGRRRRHLAVDRVTEIPHDDLQSFMQDTSHIVRKVG
ncbi:hypothetical protein DM01DRAFT_1100666 [Hesseltinella vesiculosa]|uniref:Rad21/Rec8-like protein N-terminal domain-containing protein n=1 Tax=Hesseltinella vesiculosa TaxID=101127 RepID=A0A1X2GB90_9FUNG|nr:hypothetical protein DM01DRAFT_1100666 [Hesseltinella vesiculosa]